MLMFKNRFFCRRQKMKVISVKTDFKYLGKIDCFLKTKKKQCLENKNVSKPLKNIFFV